MAPQDGRRGRKEGRKDGGKAEGAPPRHSKEMEGGAEKRKFAVYFLISGLILLYVSMCGWRAPLSLLFLSLCGAFFYV